MASTRWLSDVRYSTDFSSRAAAGLDRRRLRSWHQASIGIPSGRHEVSLSIPLAEVICFKGEMARFAQDLRNRD
jgi:hypothetical protein